MSYEITYNPNSVESHRQAVVDVLEYVGPQRFKTLVKAITLKTVDSDEMFAFLCSFTGVQGFPVRAMWERYHVEEESHDELMGHDGLTRGE